MVVVFAAFALGDFVLVKILGVALAAAVVLDATLVRLAVGPALLAIAGQWNWWPGRRAKDLPSRRSERVQVPARGQCIRVAPEAGYGAMRVDPDTSAGGGSPAAG
jgi:uncharacterized membrane protein YdfJ with MMPL/SSD domain